MLVNAAGAHPPAWTTSRMETVRCDVANVAGTAAEVAIHVGQREQRENGEAGVARLATLRLTPYSAKRLQELLAVLVNEHDRRHGGPA